MFRVYASKDNRPAAYSPQNVPYRPKKHFSISTKGVKEGDFTMIYGFPGNTQEYILSDAVAYIAERSDPAKIDPGRSTGAKCRSHLSFMGGGNRLSAPR